MVYVDQAGNRLESVDLTRGYLEDAAWVDHQETPQKVRYEYEKLPGGGQRQHTVIEQERAPAWREVTVQRYIPYTPEELEALAKGDYGARMDALEARLADCETAYREGVNEA